MTTLTEEQRAFLLHGTRTGKLATVRPDGRPHIAPIWFDLDGDTLVFMTGQETVKGRNITRDGRVTLCVDDEQPPFAFIVVEGSATTSADLAEMLRWGTQIARRYMGAANADAYGRRNAVPGELFVRVTLTNVVFAKDVAS